MIIDLHRHMWSVGERHRDAFAGMPGRPQLPEPSFDWEQTAREIVEEMDGAGVDRSVLFVADFAARLGEPPLSIEEENRLIVEAHRRYPERITAYYGIDPRRPGAADSIERAIKEWGVTGIKLHPTVGFFPHDRLCYPIYELCVSHGLPVLFHSGPAFHPKLYSRFTHPLEYDQVAADFPNLTMIMGHAGGEWWHDCIAVAHGHPNMVLEALRVAGHPAGHAPGGAPCHRPDAQRPGYRAAGLGNRLPRHTPPHIPEGEHGGLPAPALPWG